MKHAFAGLVRLVLLISIAMATVPSWSKVTVCVIEAGKVTVPIGKCRMPCCAIKVQALSVARKACCKPKASVDSADAACPLASKSCRCETRYSVAATRHAATLDRVALSAGVHGLPVILPQTRWEIPASSLEVVAPGIRGVDAGPPRKVVRTPKQSRAPPVYV